MKRLIITMVVGLSLVATGFAQEEAKEKKTKSTQEYIADLSVKDEEKIIAAADYLGSEKEKTAITPLVNLLKNDDRPRVRVYASIALGLIGEESSVDALNGALLNDSSAEVRYSAVLAISRIGSTKSIDALKAAKEKESDPYIKDYIVKMEEKFKKK